MFYHRFALSLHSFSQNTIEYMSQKSTIYNSKKIITIAYPILISLLMEQMIGLTDTAFMGRVGEVELGATAIAGVYYMVIFMVGLGFSVGAQILIGRRNGEGNYRAIGKVFYQGAFFLLGLAAVLFTLSQVFSNEILSAMISSPNVLLKAEEYMEWRVYGFFFSFMAAMFRAFFVGTTQTKTLTLNSVVMVLSNVVFNYILIFGKFGCPAFGIAGAAMGSSLAELVSLVFFIVYTRSRIDYRKYGLEKMEKPDFHELRKILGISSWIMVQNLISMSTWFIFFVYIEHLGERELAITNIVRSLSGFLFMVVLAFASTCSSVVSNMIGAGEEKQVMAVIRRHVKITYAIVLPIALLMSVLPKLFLAIYTDMPGLIDASVASVWVMCSTYLLIVPSNVYFQSVSGTGNTKTAFGLEMMALVIYVAYITVTILIMRVDVAIAWSAEAVYALIMFTLGYRYMKSDKWVGRSI